MMDTNENNAQQGKCAHADAKIAQQAFVKRSPHSYFNYASAWNKVMMFRITSEAFIMLSSGTYSNLPWKL